MHMAYLYTYLSGRQILAPSSKKNKGSMVCLLAITTTPTDDGSSAKEDNDYDYTFTGYIHNNLPHFHTSLCYD
jgi:hypothetical protein